MPYEVGQEWLDNSDGAWVVVKVEEVPDWEEEFTVTYVTVFDWEGVMTTMPVPVWDELMKELEMEEVHDPGRQERLDSWRKFHPMTFPI